MKRLRTSFDALLILALVFSQASFAVAQTLPADTTTDASTPAMEEPAPAPEMPVGPSVSSVSVTDITDTSARIDVDSDEMVQGYVEYGTTEEYGMSTPLSSEFTTNPEFLLENLTPETLYHYRVIVMDSLGSAAITADETFTTLATPEPEPTPSTDNSTSTTTPPATDTETTATTTQTTATSTPPAPALAVSNTETASVGTTTARITWQTNKSADSQVQYGTTNAYGTLSPVGVSATAHSVTLTTLTPNTKYYYRAISKTSSGEPAYGSPRQFTTLAAQAPPSPPVISDVSVSSTSASTATISWATSKPATSDIEYGTTTSYGTSLGQDSTLKTAHSRTITGLQASTLYHFRIAVADGGGTTALGTDRTFTTSAAPSAPATTTPPVVVATSTPGADALAKIAGQAA